MIFRISCRAMGELTSGMAVYLVRSASKEDQGTYHCIASNEGGSAEEAIQLLVLEAGQAPYYQLPGGYGDSGQPGYPPGQSQWNPRPETPYRPEYPPPYVPEVPSGGSRPQWPQEGTGGRPPQYPYPRPEPPVRPRPIYNPIQGSQQPYLQINKDQFNVVSGGNVRLECWLIGKFTPRRPRYQVQSRGC